MNKQKKADLLLLLATANHVGLIFTLEPVFATIVAFLFAKEVLAPRGYLGMALMLLSLLLMELDLPSPRPRVPDHSRAGQSGESVG